MIPIFDQWVEYRDFADLSTTGFLQLSKDKVVHVMVYSTPHLESCGGGSGFGSS